MSHLLGIEKTIVMSASGVSPANQVARGLESAPSRASSR